MEEEENVFTFRDDPIIAEPTYDYEEDLRLDHVPIIIDNGSYRCRSGWAYDAEPRLIFRNMIGKHRGKDEIVVGNDLMNSDVFKMQLNLLKQQFDRNVVTQYDIQEHIFDHIFSHLGIDSEGKVDHPVIMTEPLCNPNICRQHVNELLFECYGVPQVAYGVDSLFSLYHNSPKNAAEVDALIVACGYQTTHIITVLDGRVCPKYSRRINIGGAQLDAFMQRLLQLRHTAHINHISLSRAEELVQSHSFLAVDFQDEIQKWFSDDYYCHHVHKIQLPYNATVTKVDPETLKQRREEQARRLKQIVAKKREQKLTEFQDRLQELVLSKQVLEEQEDETKYKKLLRKLQVADEDELQQNINELNNSIHSLMNKITQENPSTSKDAKRPKIEKKTDIPDPPVANEAAMSQWLKEIRSRRYQLLNRKEEKLKRRSDMTRRRTQASQQRMRIITELAQGRKSKKEDTFGMKDEDWNVYKEINKDGGDSDTEAEQEKIDELETYLKEYDPEFKDPNEPSGPVDIREYYQLHVAVEQARVPEVLFQPSMVGVEQAGISETMEFVLSKLTPEEQSRVVQNVFITGGCASFNHFIERLSCDLTTMRPFQSTFKVNKAKDPVLDAWKGAGKWAMSEHFEEFAVTRNQYEEMGSGYIHEHMVTNRYFPTPRKTTLTESDSVLSMASQASV